MPDVALAARIASIRQRLLTIEAAHADGTLDDESHASARREAERELSDAVMADASAVAPAAVPVIAPVPHAARPSWRLVVVVSLVVLTIAIGGYAVTGSPMLAGLGAPPPAQVAAGNEREIGLAQIAGMVDKLAERLKDRPDDVEGWTMLARSYTVLTRYRDALPAYRHAVELQPRNAGLMADYADAIAAANDGKPTAESLALIAQALGVDPEQPKALALAGTVAFDRGDFAGAVRHWQKIADALPPDSDFHRQVVDNIDEARRRGGLPATSVAAGASPSAKASTAGREALTGVVTLDPSLAGKAAPDDTVFVLARPESGRMPLAVFRATVKDLPLRFRLDDSMAMTATMKISDMKQVIVVARVSKSGNAITQPGDLSGQSRPVAPGTGDLSIVITEVVAAR